MSTDHLFRQLETLADRVCAEQERAARVLARRRVVYVGAFLASATLSGGAVAYGLIAWTVVGPCLCFCALVALNVSMATRAELLDVAARIARLHEEHDTIIRNASTTNHHPAAP